MSDVFSQTRKAFDLPKGIIYLDGNSLGPMQHAVQARLLSVMRDEWATKLVRGWNDAGWMDLAGGIGDKIGRLIGAPAGSVLAADSTSINVFKVLTAALKLAKTGRSTVLSDTGNFPTDLYVAQGAIKAGGDRHRLRLVEPEHVLQAIDADTAVVMLTHVDYRTGRIHDMAEITARAHECGALAIWDLAHSAGALPVALAKCDADFAVGCGYKYLNGGPGAPAFLYVAARLSDAVEPTLAGWMGHEAPFAFDLDYRPAKGLDRMRVGTPPVLAMAALDAALDIWNGIDIGAVRRRSVELSERFIGEVERRCPELSLASPRDPEKRGSQVSFRFDEGYAAMQALIDRGVIGDFRAPDIMRFGFTPLYLDLRDIDEAVSRLEQVVGDRLFDDARYRQRARVT